MDVPVSPKFKFTFKKSAKVSPTVVHNTLIIQKKKVISGTLLKLIPALFFIAISILLLLIKIYPACILFTRSCVNHIASLHFLCTDISHITKAE